MRRFVAGLLAMCLAGAGLFLALAVAGCGQQESETLGRTETTPRTVVEEDLFQKAIEEMEKKAFVLEVTGSPGFIPMFGDLLMAGIVSTPGGAVTGAGHGGGAGKYSQDGKGSWRFDQTAAYSLIYNEEEKKFWFIQEKTAWESSVDIEKYQQLYPFFSLRSPLAAIANMAPPRTGPFSVEPTIAGVDGVWEWDLSKPAGTVPGTRTGAGTPPFSAEVKLRIEFLGPEGLISRIVTTNPGGTHEQLFNYTNVGDVPDEVFHIPTDVEEVRIYTPSDGPFPFPFTYGAPD